MVLSFAAVAGLDRPGHRSRCYGVIASTCTGTPFLTFSIVALTGFLLGGARFVSGSPKGDTWPVGGE
jgi:hypothetical protein